MIRAALIVLSAALLGGCFPQTREALRQDAAVKWAFEIPENYQVVYRRLAPLLRECMETAWIGDQASARTDLFTDIRKAELSVEGVNMLLGRRLQLLIELEAIGEQRTRVQVYEPAAPKPTETFRRWAIGELKTCPSLF